MNTRLHFGWLMVAFACLSLCISNGLVLSGLTIFDDHLLNEFSWSKGQLKFRDFITLSVAGLTAPFAGAAADRFGIKPLMLLGFLFLTLGFYAYGHISSLMELYLIHVGFGLSWATAGLIVNVMLVSRWFTTKRGIALGLAIVGSSLGNTLFPQINHHLLSIGGWRQGLQWAALFPLSLLPLIIFSLKEHPHQVGLLPFGAESGEDKQNLGTSSSATYRQAIATPAFWLIALAAMLTFYSMLAVSTHFFLFLSEQSMQPKMAASFLGGLFFMGFVGKLIAGFLADFIHPIRVFQGHIFVMFLGACQLASLESGAMWSFVLLFGLGWGGLYTMIQVVCMEKFGLQSAGKILGTVTVLDALGGGLGPYITGLLYDRFESYFIPFLVIMGCTGIAFCLSLGLRIPKFPIVNNLTVRKGRVYG